MKLWFITFSLLLNTFANAQGIEQDLRFEILPTGEKTLEWQGYEGRSYFIQASPDLKSWTWAPNIETGVDAPMSYEVESSTDKGFFRLQYTDQTSDDLDNADFDGDGLTNLEEITLRDNPASGGITTMTVGSTPQIQTDPLNPDTDGDGLSDGWEEAHGRDPRNPDENGNGIPDGQDDDDGDGSSNGDESVGGTDPQNENDFPVQVVMITNYAQGYAINYEAPNPTNRLSAYDFWPWNFNESYAGDAHVSMTDPCVTLNYLASVIAGDNFPNSSPLPPISSIFLLSRAGYSQIGCNVWMSASAETPATDFVLSRARIWVKAPALTHARKFSFLKTVEQSVLLNDSSFSIETIASAAPVDLIIANGQKESNYTDLEEVPISQDGSLVSDTMRLIPVQLKDIKDHTKEEDDVLILDLPSGQQINNENIAWIEAHSSEADISPRMPQLVLNIPGLPLGLTLEAKLEVQYNRGNGSRTARNQEEDHVRIPSDGSYQSISGNTWNIWESYENQPFFGGEATITYRLMSGQNQMVSPQTIHFRIGGKNPNPAKAKQFIESLSNAGATGPLWFAYAIAKTESKDYNGNGSRYNQFWQLPNGVNDTAYKSSRETHAGRPVWGNDGGTTPGGYGMFQVTGNASDSTANIPRQQIWNWQENARGALTIIESKRTIADNWIIRQKNANNANGVGLEDLTVLAITFAENSNRTINGAVTMKAWNGASAAPAGLVDSDGAAPGFIIDPQSGGHYCYWKNSSSLSNKWALSRYNNPPGDIAPFNYVTRVCQEVE